MISQASQTQIGGMLSMTSVFEDSYAAIWMSGPTPTALSTDLYRSELGDQVTL